jgi:hypothetical protein
MWRYEILATPPLWLNAQMKSRSLSDLVRPGCESRKLAGYRDGQRAVLDIGQAFRRMR